MHMKFSVKRATLLFGVSANCLLAGCASTVPASDDVVQQRTAAALGLPTKELSITGRTENGGRTDYSVATAAGKRYQCYVTGTVSSILGAAGAASDAICTPVAAASSASGSVRPSGSCDALSRAAGKC